MLRGQSLRYSWVILGLTLAACGDDKSPAAQPSESACSDGQDNDGDGFVDCADPDCRLSSETCSMAPPLDRSVASTLSEAAAFLYSGKHPAQKDADTSVFDVRRVAMLRGKVVDRGGAALPGVRVSVLGHKAYGTTMTRPDGLFDLAVNGGESLVLEFSKEHYLPVERATRPDWQRYQPLGEVGMVEQASNATSVTSDTATSQVIKGDAADGAFGPHQPLVIIAPGTSATATLPDNSTQSLSSLTVHVTESPFEKPSAARGLVTARFSPGTLVHPSALHYGVEFTVDEAATLGATAVTFSKPVSLYVENLLKLPVGAPLPLGYYDRSVSQWQSSTAGRVVKILSVASGSAKLDIDGDGSADDNAKLSAAGIDGSDVSVLASHYSAGTTLWRFSLSHFSSWDAEFPTTAPSDATLPVATSIVSRPLDEPSRKGPVLVEPQALSQSLPITGTPYSLQYQTNRTSAYGQGFQLELPLITDTVPAGLTSILCTVDIVGQHLSQTLEPAAGLKAVIPWNGDDGFGRAVQGPQTALVTLAYYYDGSVNLGDTYGATGSSVTVPSASLPAGAASSPLVQAFEVPLGVWDAKGYALGGFSLDILHAYDAAHQTLFYGWGDQRSAENVALLVKQPVKSFNLGTPDSVAIAGDGTAFVTDDEQQDVNALGRILKIAPDGSATVIAGPGAAGNAAKLQFGQPQGIVVKADGSVIIADFGRNAIQQLSPNGTMTTLISNVDADQPVVKADVQDLDNIALGLREELYIVNDDRVYRLEASVLSTFAGGGDGGDGPATSAKLIVPSGLAVAPDGSVFISERGDTTHGCRVRKVLPDGTIRTIAGTGTPGFSGDGGPATNATLNGPRGIALARDGSLFIADQNNNRIRIVTPDGVIQTAVGGGTAAIKEGQLATEVALVEPDGIAVGKDGALYISADTVYRVSPGMPQISTSNYLLPSADGRTLYQFDARGKHQATLDAMTGVTELSFSYDSTGHLSSISDVDGQTTKIERDGSGNPTGIVAPFGQKTRLSLTNGAITAVTDELSRSVAFAYDNDRKLLSSSKDAKGSTDSFTYDPLGRLTNVKDPTGNESNLTPNALPDGFGVTFKSPEGRQTTHAVHYSGNTVTRSLTLPDLSQSSFKDALSSLSQLSADGSTKQVSLTADPAFGTQSPNPSQIDWTTPSGKTLTAYPLRAKRLTDIDNALSVEEWSDQLEINGRIYQTVYKRADRSLATTSPMGRVTTTTLDAKGHLTDMTSPGLASSHLDYDSSGHLVKITRSDGQQSRVTSFNYGRDGWLASHLDALGHTTSIARDKVGRVTALTRPDKQAINWTFDEDDNVLSLTPPGRSAFTFDYDNDNYLTSSEAPAVSGNSAMGQLLYNYGKDHELTSIEHSDNRQIAFAYNATTGQLTTQTLGSAKLSFGYDSAGKLTSLNRSDSVAMTLSYDGPLFTGVSYSGAIKGSVQYTYDDNFWLASLNVNNSSSSSYAYDDDGLLVSASSTGASMTLTRDAQTGMITGTTLGSVSTTEQHNAFGELLGVTALNKGNTSFSQTLTRDQLGRVTHITENIGTDSHDLYYTYDELGRLTEVERDGAITGYAYDPNGNRTSVTVDGVATISAAYDAQDRILSSGTAQYTHSDHGDLAKRTDSANSLTLTHDEFGQLQKAVVVKGSTKTIDYVIDGLGRRVARKLNGGFDRAWLYRDALRPVSEIDNAGTFTHYIYANDAEAGAPDYMVRSGAPYRFIKDHLGSVRRVINAQTGAVAQSIEYDPFGQILSDTSPGFQPFGFAGGLYDWDTGLTHFGAREYDPSIGRWVTKDPIGFGGGDSNVYVYCANEPIDLVDPSGLEPIEVTIIDNSDYVGWIAAATRRHHLFMTNVSTMVSRVNSRVGANQIQRLNILDHGNSDGFEVGDQFVTIRTMPLFESTFAKLRGKFAPGGFIHLQHCSVGNNFPLLVWLSRIVGVPVYAGTGSQNPLLRVNYGHYVRCTPKGCERSGRP